MPIILYPSIICRHIEMKNCGESTTNLCRAGLGFVGMTKSAMSETFLMSGHGQSRPSVTGAKYLLWSSEGSECLAPKGVRSALNHRMNVVRALEGPDFR